MLKKLTVQKPMVLPKIFRDKIDQEKQLCDKKVILREVYKSRDISSKQLKSELNLPIEDTQIHMRVKEAECDDRISRQRPFISERNARGD